MGIIKFFDQAVDLEYEYRFVSRGELKREIPEKMYFRLFFRDDWKEVFEQRNKNHRIYHFPSEKLKDEIIVSEKYYKENIEGKKSRERERNNIFYR